MADGSRPRRWTQKHVAELVGTERTYYLLWYSGEWSPSPATLIRLTEILEVQPHELVSTDLKEASLTQLRQLDGLTQADVAGQLGVSSSLYSLVELGRQRLDDAKPARLAEVLGFPSSESAGWCRSRGR